MEFPELDSIQENGEGQSILKKPPQMSEQDFKQFELFFPSEGHEASEQMMEMQKIINTALIPESIQHAYGIKMSVGGSRDKKRKKEDKSFNNQSNDIYIERTNAQGRKIRIRQIGMVNKSSAIGDLSSYLTRDEMKLRAKSLAYAQYRKLRQEESKAKAHRKLMFLLVVVKCKAFATRMKRRIIEKRRIKEEAEGKQVIVVQQDFKRRSSVMLSRESSMRSFTGSFSNYNMLGGNKKPMKISNSMRDKKFRQIRIMSEEDSVTQGELYYQNATPQLAPSHPASVIAPSAQIEHETQMSEQGSKKIISPEVQRVSSNASTLVEIGKGAKLDVVALKAYLESLKRQKRQEQGKEGLKIPQIQRLSPGGSESMLKRFSQSSIGPPPQYMSVEEHSFRADEELTLDIKSIDKFLIGKGE